jgi:hypothetical protein
MPRNLLFALLVLPACVPAPSSYALRGVDVQGGRAWVTAVQTSTAGNARWLVAACPRDGDRVGRSCEWSEIAPPTQATLTAARARPTIRGRESIEAEAAAARDHECEGASVVSQHEEDAGPAFWLDVCGRQRFYRLSGDPARYVDGTPAGQTPPAPERPIEPRPRRDRPVQEDPLGP